MIQRILFTRN